MAVFTDSFDRANTATGAGLGSIPGSSPAVFWEHNGSWQITSNKPNTGTSASSNPYAVINANGSDLDLTMAAIGAGGDAIYFRVTDSANWMRVRTRWYQTSSTSTYTEYEWQGYYFHATHGGYADNTASQGSATANYWGGFSSYPGPSSIQVAHNHGAGFNVTSAYPLGGGEFSPQKTGQQRQVNGGTTTTDYFQVIVEKCVAGVVTQLSSANVGAPTSLRVRAQGTAISVFVNGAASAALTLNDSTHSTATRHGFGRAASDVYSAQSLDGFTLDSLNTPPTAPTLVFPVSSAVIDRAGNTVFDWTFGDPDVSDFQSAYEFRYRPTGAATWTTTGKVASTATERTISGSTLAAGDHEWQVRTYDSQGLESPWSSSGFFTAATRPSAPTILDPLNGGTIPTTSYLARWSAGAQDAYQIRVLDGADALISDSGVVESASTREYTVDFPVNGVTRKLQIRVRTQGLWSDYTTHSLTVSYTRPAPPVVRVTPDDATASTVVDVFNSTAWGYGGSTTAKSSASPTLIDLDDLSAPRILWLPGVAGNYVSTPDVNEVDYDSSTFENSIGRWEGLNKNLLDADDSSFETAAGAYINQVGGTRSRVTTPTFTGAGALALTKNATAGNMSFYTSFGSAAGAGSQPKYQSIVPGQVYTYSAQFRAGTTPRLTRLRLQFFKADHSNSAQAESLGPMVADNSAGWTQKTMTVQAPADARGVALFLDVFDCAAGEVHYVDAVGLFETPNGNLVANPDFENGAAGWSSDASVISASTERSYTGRSSLKIERTTNVRGGAAHTFATVTGSTYTMSAWVYSLAARQVTLAASPGATSDAPVSVAANTWTRVTRTFVATGTSTTLFFSGLDSLGTIYVDAVQVVVGSTALEFLPPTTHNLVMADPVLGGPILTGSTLVAGSTDRAYVGSTSAKFSTTGTAGNVRALFVASTVQTPSLTASGWFYNASASTIQVVGEFVGHDYAPGTPVRSSLAPGAWTRLVYTLSGIGVEARAASVQFVLEGVPANSSVYIDAVQVEAGSVATPYTDGGLGAGYAWDSSSNLVSNPSFETDTAGWEGLNKNLLTANQSSVETDTTGVSASTNCTIARSTVQALVGTASLAITATAAGDTIAEVASNASRVAVVPGQVYTYSLSSRAGATPRQLRLDIDWYDASGTRVLYDSSGPRGSDHTAGWSQQTRTVQAPTNAVSARLLVTRFGSAVGEVHYVDAVSLMETPNGNLVPDGGDFEKVTSGFGLLGSATGGVSQEQSYTGRSSFKAVATTTGHAVRQAQISQVITEGSTVSFSSYVKVTSGANVNMVFEHWTAGGAYVGSTQTAFTNVNAWTRLSTTFTLPANAARYNIAFNTQGAATFYVDAVQVVIGSSPVEYLPPSTVNLLLNPSAEVNVSDWLQGGPATITRSTSQAYVGSASAFLHCNAGTNHIYANVPDPVRIPVTPGATFTGSMYVRPRDNARLVRVSVSCFDASGNSVAAVTTPATAVSIPVGSWTRVVTAATVIPAGAVTARLTLTVENAATNDGFYLDAAQLEQGSVATPYVDGSLGAGYAWEASENAALNPEFAVDTSSWSWTVPDVTTTSLARVATGGPAGGPATYGDFRTTLDAARTYRVVQQNLSSGARYPVDTVITMSFWARYGPGQTTTAGTASVRLLDPAATNGSWGTFTFTPTATWQRFTFTGRIYGSGVGPNNTVYINLPGPATEATEFHITGMQIEAKDYATPYGSTGAAHASPSKRQRPWVVGGSSVEASGLEPGRNFARSGQVGRVASGTWTGLTWFPRYAEAFTAGIETRVDVAPSTTYTLSGNFSGGTINTAMRVVDGTTGAALETTGPQGSVPGLRKHALTFTTGPTTTSVRLQFVNADYVTSDSYDNAKYIYVDAVQLEQRSYATAFSSTGAANASTSTRQQPWVLGGTALETLARHTTSTWVDRQGTAHLSLAAAIDSQGGASGLRYAAVVAASTVYTLSAKTLAYQPIKVTVVDQGGATLATGSSLPLTFTTASTSTTVSLRIALAGTRQAFTTAAMYLDAVQLERGSSASAYTLPTRIVGDLDVRAHVALEDWTQPYDQTLISRWRDADLGRSFAFQARTTGHLSLYWTADGTSTLFATSTAVVPVADGGRLHVRATLDVDNGASGRTVRFYTSADGVTWTPLGSDVVSAGVTSVAPGGNSVPVHVGTLADNSSILRGKVLSASVRAGIDGTVVAAYDATAHDLSSPNLVLNGNFDGGSTAGWNGLKAGSVVSASADQAYAGKNSLKVTTAGTAAFEGAQYPVVVATQTTYTASAWVYFTASGITANLRFALGGVGALGTSQTYTSTAAGWAYLTATGTTTTATGGYSVDITTGTATAARTFYVDSVQLERGSVATAYRPHPDETLDSAGKRWSITRAGNATAEIVDRNTWAFTGTEYLTLPDRDDLDLGVVPGASATVVAGFKTRGTNGAPRLYDKGAHNVVSGYGLYLAGGTAGGFLSSTGPDPVTSGGASLNDGTHHVVGYEIDGTRHRAISDGTLLDAVAHGVSDNITNTGPARIGMHQTVTTQDQYHGLISWVAMFKRVLTAEEHAELAAWDGSPELEPRWLRTDAVLYVNADDENQREQYAQRNLVLNQARTVTEGGVASDLPAVIENRVWRSEKLLDGTWTEPIRIGKQVNPDGTFVDWTPLSATQARYEVESVGDNQTTSWSGSFA